MPFNGSGGFTIINTFVPGTTILSSAVNQNYSDIATAGLSNCLTKDGQQTWGANQKAGGFLISGLAAGSAAGNSVEWQQFQNQAVPIGALMDFGGTSAPSKWLLCDGTARSRTTYSALFGIIGTTWGIGDGVSTFNVPDFRGRVIAGIDNMGGSAASRITTLVTDSGTIVGTTIGSSGGSQSHVQASGELATHNHTASSSDGAGHSHGITTGSGNTGFTTTGTGINTSLGVGSTGNDSDSVTIGTAHVSITTTVNNNGSSTAMAWLQPTIMCNKIIFANA